MHDGIDLYLTLKGKCICDFVLYTSSKQESIIKKLTEYLKDEQDPNLFSRFTFVSRHNGGKEWHKEIINVINHILTKREEINNLRGLYAQLTAKIQHRLMELLETKNVQIQEDPSFFTIITLSKDNN